MADAQIPRLTRSGIPEIMLRLIARRMVCALAVWLAASLPALPQKTDAAQQPDSSQQPGSFYWVNFHSPKDQSIVTWVTRALTVDDWTAIREIGVMYDSALVITSKRITPQSLPDTDSFDVWNVSLTSHLVTPILKGVNLRWLAMLRFYPSFPMEPVVLYNNCRQCAANTYFTAFHYNVVTRRWEARWVNGGNGVTVWNSSHPEGIDWTQVYAVMTGGDGIAHLVTWNHFDFGPNRPPEDSIFRYDVDPFSGLDRTAVISGKPADAMKTALCSAQDAVAGLARGQDSDLCKDLLHPGRSRERARRSSEKSGHGAEFSKPLRGVPARRTAPPNTAAPPESKSAPQHQ